MAMVAKEARLRDNEFRYIERILYDYVTHGSAIAELQAELDAVLDELLPDPKGPSMSDTPGIMATDEKSSEPERWAIRREQNAYVKHLRERIAERRRHRDIVDAAMGTLTEQEQTFCRLFYNQAKSIKACSSVMHYGARRIYNIRHAVVHKVARFAGVR